MGVLLLDPQTIAKGKLSDPVRYAEGLFLWDRHACSGAAGRSSGVEHDGGLLAVGAR